jgi:type VI secretion system FHA domain protein
MPIEITIINSPSTVGVSKSSYTFSDEGGTLGRGANNFWVLEDPNKYMSSVHAKISCLGDQYFLTDLSTNGTFINDASEPVGNGNQVMLNEGDRFIISDYEFVTKISNVFESANAFQEQGISDPFLDVLEPASINDDPFLSTGNDPFASGVGSSDVNALSDFNALSVNHAPISDSLISSFDAEQTDPLMVLDKATDLSNDPFAASVASVSDINNNSIHQTTNNNAATDSIDWPMASQESGLIPDDWDESDLMADLPVVNEIPPAVISSKSSIEAPVIQTPVTPAQVAVVSNSSARTEESYLALEQKNKNLLDEISLLKQKLIESNGRNNRAESTPDEVLNQRVKDELNSVVNAMGLAKWNLDNKKVTEINETVGLLMRETMQGMMRVLKFRKKIKEEFRINVTTIQSIENNPLKFSANIDDAMENMFIKQNNAYKTPVDAVREGFQSIAEHQVAVIAGMQAAFRGMIDRFDPTNLENRFEKYKSSSLLSLGQKSKRWNAYKEYHQGLIDNLDDSFQHLFGYDFVQAYEDQMQRLISARLIPSKASSSQPSADALLKSDSEELTNENNESNNV